jgi:hypothetical protein
MIEHRSFKEVVKLKIGKMVDPHFSVTGGTHGEDHIKIQREDSHLQCKVRVLRGNQPANTDLGLLTSRTVRKSKSFV